jgi:uncharacterized phage protein gp47/JayE
VSFSAEPYGVFVDDLVSSLTGGVVRERMTFVPEARPFKLGSGPDHLPGTVRIHGIAGRAYQRFAERTDFDVAADGTIVFREGDAGLPANGASWPDVGTLFWVSYERRPDPQAPPMLTDRNPGSVLRTVAESFAREYAVFSHQLESVYDAAFIATATGRDLDAIAGLVGVERRNQLNASGEIVFSRTTPAPADVFIPEGTLVSTSDVPPVTVETTGARTLRAGSLSVAVPVQSLVSGRLGQAAAGTLTVIHRPILGITQATNAEPLAFAGSAETDEGLRRRTARALDTAGRSTTGAIIGSLASIDGIREQDVLVSEDHVSSPGVVRVVVATSLDDHRAALAAQRLEEVRPAGVRIQHNLKVIAQPPVEPGPGGGAGEGTVPAAGVRDGVFYPVAVSVAVTPASTTLTAAERSALVTSVEQAARAEIGRHGVGEPVIYNQLVAAVMVVTGVFDAVIELSPVPPAPPPQVPPVPPGPPVPPAGRHNLFPTPPDTRIRLDSIDVTLRGAPIALDVHIVAERKGLLAAKDPATGLEDVRRDVSARLAAGIRAATAPITPALLAGMLTETATYKIDHVSYSAEFLDEGLRVLKDDATIRPTAEQVPWIRSVTVTEHEQAAAQAPTP